MQYQRSLRVAVQVGEQSHCGHAHNGFDKGT